MIPDEAVEAAARAYFELCGGKWEQARYRDAELADMRAALEAASPYMLAEAWDEGRVVGMMDPHRIEQSIKLDAPDYAEVANPYR